MTMPTNSGEASPKSTPISVGRGALGRAGGSKRPCGAFFVDFHGNKCSPRAVL